MARSEHRVVLSLWRRTAAGERVGETRFPVPEINHAHSHHARTQAEDDPQQSRWIKTDPAAPRNRMENVGTGQRDSRPAPPRPPACITTRCGAGARGATSA